MKRLALLALLLLAPRIAHAVPICAIDISSNFTAAMTTSTTACGVIPLQWNLIEVTEGAPDFSTIDTQTALIPAGKIYWIDVYAGMRTPAFVYTDGALSFTHPWNFAQLSDGQFNWPTLCAPATYPRPGDAVYLTKLTNFLTALKAHFTGDAKWTGIKLNPFGSDTSETSVSSLPSVQPIKNLAGGIACFSNNDVANWDAIPYAQADFVNAAHALEAVFVSVFCPNPSDCKAMSLQLLPLGFPHDNNIENGGSAGITDLGNVEVALMADGKTNVPRFESQFDGWNADIALRGVDSYQEGGSSSTAGNSLTQWYVALTNRIHRTPKSFEIYDVDIVNPANATILQLMAFIPPTGPATADIW